jgi:hypothetical protein
MTRPAARSRSIPPVRWRRGIIDDDHIILSISEKVKAVADVAEYARSDDLKIVGDELIHGYSFDWSGGCVRISVGDELHLDVETGSTMRTIDPIGVLEASTFSIVHAPETGPTPSGDGRATAARLRRIARVLERSVKQDGRRLESHEEAAALLRSRLSAILTAYTDDAHHGAVRMPGPHGPFSFSPARRDLRDPVLQEGFAPLVERIASMAKPMISMTAGIRGTNIEIRIGSCRDLVQGTDPMETIRILADMDASAHPGPGDRGGAA